MSRRARKIVKRVSLDPKYNSELVAHMIRVIMKDGKKSVAEKIVYGAIDKIKDAMAADPAQVYLDYVSQVYGGAINGEDFVAGLTADLG